MLRKEQLKRVQLLRDALDVVQTVDTNDDLAALETLLKLLETSLYLDLVDALRKALVTGDVETRGLTYVHELLRVNSDGECCDVRVSPLEFDTVGHSGKPENART